MKLVVDETLGRFQLENVLLKPVNTKNGPEPLDKVLENKKSKFTRKLEITPFSQLDQINYFKNLDDASEIVYFYDPKYTDGNILRRLQNWLYPDQSLYIYPIYHNRATLYMLLDKLSQTTLESSSSIINTIEQYCSSAQEWIITPSPKAFYKKNGKFIYKKKKPKQFKLLTYENSRLRIKKSGALTELVEEVVTSQDDPSQIWVVEKELSSDLPLDTNVKHYKLEKSNLPINVPFIHFVKKSTLN